MGRSDAVKATPTETKETAVKAITKPVKPSIGLLCDRNKATRNQFM